MWVESFYRIRFIVTWVIILYASLLWIDASYCTKIIVTRVILLYKFCCDLPWTHVLYTGLDKYMQPLIVTPEALPETSVLANHSSDFSLVGQPYTQTCLWSLHHNLKKQGGNGGGERRKIMEKIDITLPILTLPEGNWKFCGRERGTWDTMLLKTIFWYT